METTLTMAHAGDPETSFEAAEHMLASGALTDQQAEVLEAIRLHPGLTARDLATVSGLDYYAIQRRAGELVSKRQVRRGEKVMPRSGGRQGETLWPT